MEEVYIDTQKKRRNILEIVYHRWFLSTVFFFSRLTTSQFEVQGKLLLPLVT